MTAFLAAPGPDAILRRSLECQKAGCLPQAVFWAATAAQVAGGPSFFESHALAAALLARAGFVGASLAYWEKIAISAPQKLEWLEKALLFALRLSGESEEARRHLGRWRQLLANVYTATPSLQILQALADHGLGLTGAIGIHAGRVRGWAWLPRNTSLRLNIRDLPPKCQWQLTLRPRLATDSHVLYELDEELPKEYFRLELTDSAGAHLQGSPLICSPPKLAAGGKGNGASLTVIIPVYDDARATLACLGSVLASLKRNVCRPQILVAWDCGPDSSLLAKLRSLAARGKIRLLENPGNMGFLATVNRALAQTPSGDVLLLNADTLVHGNWLDRFVTAAATVPHCATITALGNEAELMSYPSFRDRGRITSMRQVALLDKAAATLPAEQAALEMPVGVGFCMLITRAALRKIGGLDGRQIFRGYGEETEFCLRVRREGLKNYGLYNVFVGHLGERSFGLGKKSLAAQNNLVIHEQFPTHKREYEQYLFASAPKALRRHLALGTLASLKPLDTLEIRPWAGRILPPWLKDKQCEPRRRGAALFLRPGTRGKALLRIWAEIPVLELTFQMPRELEQLRYALGALPWGRARYFLPSAPLAEFAAQLALEPPNGQNTAEAAATLNPLTQEPQVLMLAPPFTLAGYRQLLTLGSRWPRCQFYIFYWQSIWPNNMGSQNLRELPMMEDYSPLQAEGLALLDNFADSQGWREWLDTHNCGNLPIYHGVNLV